jgi:hypothetical protein
VSSLRTRINIRKARGHRDAARVFHAKPKVSATRCGAFTLRLLKFSPGQFNIATAAVPIQCHVRTSRHEPNQRQGEFTGRKTLKRVVSRRRRVIGFSLQHVYPAFPPALLPRLPLQRASSSAPCVRRRVSLGLAWLGLSESPLQTATASSLARRRKRQIARAAGEGEGNREEEEHRAPAAARCNADRPNGQRALGVWLFVESG